GPGTSSRGRLGLPRREGNGRPSRIRSGQTPHARDGAVPDEGLLRPARAEEAVRTRLHRRSGPARLDRALPGNRSDTGPAEQQAPTRIGWHDLGGGDRGRRRRCPDDAGPEASGRRRAGRLQRPSLLGPSRGTLLVRELRRAGAVLRRGPPRLAPRIVVRAADLYVLPRGRRHVLGRSPRPGRRHLGEILLPQQPDVPVRRTRGDRRADRAAVAGAIGEVQPGLAALVPETLWPRRGAAQHQPPDDGLRRLPGGAEGARRRGGDSVRVLRPPLAGRDRARREAIATRPTSRGRREREARAQGSAGARLRFDLELAAGKRGALAHACQPQTVVLPPVYVEATPSS